MALNRHTNVDPSSGAAGHLSEKDRAARCPIPKGPLLVRWSRPADGRGCQSSAHLLHHDPVAPDLVEVELDRCDGLRRLRVGCLDRPQDLVLGAQQDDAPAAFDQLGELGGGVINGAASGWLHSGASRDMGGYGGGRVQEQEGPSVWVAGRPNLTMTRKYRTYVATLHGEYLDIRGLQAARPDLYSGISYADSQVFGEG